jgi:hypothetical protein
MWTLAFVACLAQLPQPTAPAAAPAVIRGQVIDSADAKPVRRARVLLTPETRAPGLAPRATRTNERGEYEFAAETRRPSRWN